MRVILEATTSSFARGMQQARAQTGGLLGSVSRNRAELTKLGLGLTAAGALATKAFLGMGRESIAFNAEVTKLTTQVGIARSEALALGAAATGLGIAAGKGPQEMAEALFFVASAGLRGGEALAVLNASAKASAIGLGETKVVADLVTSAVNAYGSETLTASAATDILIGAVREGKAEAPALAGALGRVLPIASEMGVRFDEVGAAVAAMTRTGTDAATATTQLRAMLQGLIKPAAQTEKELGKLGLSSAMLRDTIQRDGLWSALMMLKDAIGDNDEALGKIFPNQRALLGFLDLTGANATDNARIFANLADSTGNLADATAEWALTTEASQKRFSAAMAAARLSLGEGVEPVMKSVLEAGTGLALMFSEIPEPARKAGAGIATVGAGLLTVAGTGALALVGISHVRDAMKNLNISASSLLRFGFNPLTVGLAGLGAILFTVAQRKADLHRRSATLATILGEEIDLVRRSRDAWSDLSDVTRRGVAENLLREHEGLLDVLDATGLSLDTVAEALINRSGPAYDAVTAAIERHTRVTDIQGQGIERRTGVGQELAKILGIEEEALAGALAEAEALATVQSDGADVADDFAGAQEETATAADLAADAYTEATDALAEYVDEMRAAVDPVFAVIDGLTTVDERQRAYNEAVDEFGENSAEARSAALDVAKAVSDVEQAVLDGDLSWQDFDATLKRWVTQGVLTEGQAEAIRESVSDAKGAADDYTGDYPARLLLERDQAKERAAQKRLDEIAAKRLARVLPNLDGRRAGQVNRSLNSIARNRSVTITPVIGSTVGAVRVSGAGFSGRIHTGGVVTNSGRIRRFHDGGPVLPRFHDGVTLASDEVPAILQTGEVVLSRAQVAMMKRTRYLELVAREMVRLGDVTDDEWEQLLALGWQGKAGDRMEALYPPLEGVRREFIKLGEVTNAEWQRLMRLGWQGKAGDRMEALYPPLGSLAVEADKAAKLLRDANLSQIGVSGKRRTWDFFRSGGKSFAHIFGAGETLALGQMGEMQAGDFLRAMGKIPKAHEGGQVIGADEGLAVLQRGEAVVSKRDMAMAAVIASRSMSAGTAGGGGGPMDINVIVEGRGPVGEARAAEINHMLRKGQLNIRAEAIAR